ncbi:MAG: helix-turn-helix domain-containing protein [Hoeflea sp.]|nr:helix-turn-helix domain-containing protein [Hoeflea sp.]
MDQQTALDAFSALSQETRLAVFRLLVASGPEGLASGEIGERLGVRQNTMSTNLGILLKAGLVRRVRDGRNVRYQADHSGISGLLGFLLEDCCGGKPDLCQPVIRQISCA